MTYDAANSKVQISPQTRHQLKFKLQTDRRAVGIEGGRNGMLLDHYKKNSQKQQLLKPSLAAEKPQKVQYDPPMTFKIKLIRCK